MSEYNVAIDALLAAALRGEDALSDRLWAGSGSDVAVIERIKYHGIAGLLGDLAGRMTGWPETIRNRVNDLAVAQAMWELRHRQVLNELLGELAGAKVAAILLKGTAIAYDLYRTPATRDRGDSDVLVEPKDLAQTRYILKRLGFERITGNSDNDSFSLQEVWRRVCDRRVSHHIDLHWQLLNAPALEAVLPVTECAASLVALPRLGPDARAVDRVRTLIHTCIHRKLHSTSPYFVDGRPYYGANRLIWLNDIHLLAGALSPDEWRTLTRLADSKGVSAPCLDGLLAANYYLATILPASICEALRAASPTRGPAAYLRSRQAGRAWLDLQAVPGLRRKFGYVCARALPSPAFLRSKYPGHAGLPVLLLYARRMFDLIRARPTQSPNP